MVYVMALSRLRKTDACIGHAHVLPYLEQLYERDIVAACADLGITRLQITPVYAEWKVLLPPPPPHPFLPSVCARMQQNTRSG